MDFVDIHICSQVKFWEMSVSLHVGIQSHGKGFCKWTQQLVGVELNDRTDCWTGRSLGPKQTHKQKGSEASDILSGACKAIYCEMLSVWYSRTTLWFFKIKWIVWHETMVSLERATSQKMLCQSMLPFLMYCKCVCPCAHHNRIPKICHFQKLQAVVFDLKNTRKYISCLFLAFNVQQLYTMIRSITRKSFKVDFKVLKSLLVHFSITHVNGCITTWQ